MPKRMIRHRIFAGESSDKPEESSVEVMQEMRNMVPLVPEDDGAGGAVVLPGTKLAGEDTFTFLPAIHNESNGSPSASVSASASYKKVRLMSFQIPGVGGDLIAAYYSSLGSGARLGECLGIGQEFWGGRAAAGDQFVPYGTAGAAPTTDPGDIPDELVGYWNIHDDASYTPAAGKIGSVASQGSGFYQLVGRNAVAPTQYDIGHGVSGYNNKRFAGDMGDPSNGQYFARDAVLSKYLSVNDQSMLAIVGRQANTQDCWLMGYGKLLATGAGIFLWYDISDGSYKISDHKENSPQTVVGTFPLNTMACLGLTVDTSGNYKVFKDGAKIGEGTYSIVGPDPTPTPGIWFGGAPNSASTYKNSEADLFYMAYWTRELTEDEMKGQTASLLAQWNA